MHGVVMIPLAAPHEAVRLEHAHDLPWNLVLVLDAAALAPSRGYQPLFPQKMSYARSKVTVIRHADLPWQVN